MNDKHRKCSTMTTSMGPRDVKRFSATFICLCLTRSVRDNKRKLTIPLKMCNTMRSTSLVPCANALALCIRTHGFNQMLNWRMLTGGKKSDNMKIYEMENRLKPKRAQDEKEEEEKKSIEEAKKSIDNDRKCYLFEFRKCHTCPQLPHNIKNRYQKRRKSRTNEEK